MKTKIKVLLDKYTKAEQDLITALDELERAGVECGCDGEDIIKIGHEEKYDEIKTLCLSCGGFTNEE